MNQEINNTSDKEENITEAEKFTKKSRKRITCDHCGNNSFRLYIEIIIDDAVLFCAKCNREY